MEPSYLLACGGLALAISAVVFGVVCLFLVKGKLRAHMAVAVGVFLGTLLLWAGGNWVLGQFGLAWRNWVVWPLAILLFLSGVWGIVCDIRCLRELLRDRKALRLGVTVLSVAAGMMILWYGGLIGAIAVGLGAGPERVVSWEGQRLVEVDESFMDVLYAYYPYRGPLVRGTERVVWHGEGDEGGPQTVDGDRDYVEIRWKNRVYAPFCVVSKGERGMFLSVSSGGWISAWRDYPPEDWLVSWIPQDGGAMLYKELTVTDIPEGLEAEYDWWEEMEADG